MRRSGRALAPAVLAVAAATGCDAPPGARVDAPAGSILDRPDTPGTTRMFSFEPGDVVETFGSANGHFLIHFTRNGVNAVPPADTDVSGVPDYVELVATTYDAVFDHYGALGFLQPLADDALADNGGDGRFDVYLVDFNGVGDGHYSAEGCVKAICTGFMSQENDFLGYGYPSLAVAVRTLASHEYFHAIQAAYDSQQGSVLAEGTATWGTETFDATLKDFESQIAGYMENTTRPLDEPLGGPVDPFSYGTALWFWFLEERYADTPGIVRGLIEKTKDGANGAADPQWFDVLDAHLQATAGVPFADAFAEFARWNLFTSTHSDSEQAYATGYAYPAPKMEAVAAPYTDPGIRAYHASTQYLRVPVDGRAAMGAAIVSKVAGDTDGLRLMLAVDDGSDYVVTSVAELGAGQTVATNGAEDVVVAIVNTAMSGESKRPGLCIGTADEIAACKASIMNPMGAGGAGGAGGSGVGGTGGGGAADDGDGDGGGCSCEVGPVGADGAPWLAALAGYGLVRARRRRRPSA